MKTPFTIDELVNHITNQAIIADANMQLEQTHLWNEFSKNVPISGDESHLKFLGVEELSFSAKLDTFKPSLWYRIIHLFDKKSLKSQYLLSQSGIYTLKITLSRNAQKQFETEIVVDKNAVIVQ